MAEWRIKKKNKKMNHCGTAKHVVYGTRVHHLTHSLTHTHTHINTTILIKIDNDNKVDEFWTNLKFVIK